MTTARERIGDALYLLAAGADKGVLMDTLRAYVVAHTKTREDMAKLLDDLRQAQPDLVREYFAERKAEIVSQLSALDTNTRRLVEALSAAKVSAVRAAKRAAKHDSRVKPPKKAPKKHAARRALRLQ